MPPKKKLSKNRSQNYNTNSSSDEILQQGENSETDSESDSDSDTLDSTDLDINAPPEFICPITMSIMKDPVLMPDGQTYERKAIEKYLKIKSVSPITKEPMKISQAKKNYALKSLIDHYIEDHLKDQFNRSFIDPKTMQISTYNLNSEIPITEIKKIKLKTFSAKYTADSMLITIKPQKINGRLPISIIAIIDISDSMKKNASLPELDEDEQISRIQLVQLSLKTIISILGDSDQITLITFSDKVQLKASAIKLTQEGKERVKDIIDDLKPVGNTDLWGGLNEGINEAIKQKTKKMNTSLLVFTDGEPNHNPPCGLITALKEKLNGLNTFFSISTFGYGYDVDPELLEEISEIGNGIYGYCPYSKMVGTTLIHYIANMLSMVSPLTTLTVIVDQNNKYQLNIALYNNSETNVMIPLNKNDDPETVIINLKPKLTRQVILVDNINKLDENDNQELMNFYDQKYRKKLIDTIMKTKDCLPLDEMKENVIELYEEIRNDNNRSQFMRNLLLDLCNDDEHHGEIERAYNKDIYNKWGKNYVYSLIRFHILEQCGNCKSMSLQLYGNEYFNIFKQIGNTIFNNLPKPDSNCFNKSKKKIKISMKMSKRTKKKSTSSDDSDYNLSDDKNDENENKDDNKIDDNEIKDDIANNDNQNDNAHNNENQNDDDQIDFNRNIPEKVKVDSNSLNKSDSNSESLNDDVQFISEKLKDEHDLSDKSNDELNDEDDSLTMSEAINDSNPPNELNDDDDDLIPLISDESDDNKSQSSKKSQNKKSKQLLVSFKRSKKRIHIDDDDDDDNGKKPVKIIKIEKNSMKDDSDNNNNEPKPAVKKARRKKTTMRMFNKKLIKF